MKFPALALLALFAAVAHSQTYNVGTHICTTVGITCSAVPLTAPDLPDSAFTINLNRTANARILGINGKPTAYIGVYTEDYITLTHLRGTTLTSERASAPIPTGRDESTGRVEHHGHPEAQ